MRGTLSRYKELGMDIVSPDRVTAYLLQHQDVKDPLYEACREASELSGVESIALSVDAFGGKGLFIEILPGNHENTTINAIADLQNKYNSQFRGLTGQLTIAILRASNT